jgi:hypothetical protein
MPFDAGGIFKDNVSIAGRAIPVWVLGGGLAILAALVFLISKNRAGAVSVPATTGTADAGGSTTGATPDQLTLLENTLNGSITSQIAASNADYTGQLTALGGQFQQQVAAQGQSFNDQMAAQGQSLGGQIGGVQTDINNLRATYQEGLGQQQQQIAAQIAGTEAKRYDLAGYTKAQNYLIGKQIEMQPMISADLIKGDTAMANRRMSALARGGQWLQNNAGVYLGNQNQAATVAEMNAIGNV